MASAPPHVLLADPAWLPDRIDWKNRLVRMVRTNHAIVTESAFLDGRTPLSAKPDQVAVIAVDAFAGMADARPRLRWILHESFCGSTLAGRLLSVPGTSLCLREPQVLVDLCNWRLAIGNDGDLADFSRVADGLLAKLAQRWSDNEAIVIKPSNWINPIVHELVRADRGDLAAVVRIPAAAFLVAVFRGGRERVDYSLRLYQQFAAHWPQLGRVVDREIGRDASPLDMAARLVVATLWSQECVFRSCFGQDLARRSLIFPDFTHQLTASMQQAAAMLDLDITSDAMRRSVDRHGGLHSKDPGRRRSLDEEEAHNRSVEAAYAEPIKGALAFFDRLCLHESEIVAPSATVDQSKHGGLAG